MAVGGPTRELILQSCQRRVSRLLAVLPILRMREPIRMRAGLDDGAVERQELVATGEVARRDKLKV